MTGIFSNIRSKFSDVFTSSADSEMVTASEKEYVELDTESGEHIKGKIIVRPFTITDFSDIKTILDVLREGSTIALVNIKPLKDKDLIELKRAINKLKKTTDAIEGDIAGFGDDYIIVTPSFAKVYRTKSAAVKEVKPEEEGVIG
ncbi:MAG: cell division protein SepF [bacterium]|nr:cell division protein SepF [bacterium]